MLSLKEDDHLIGIRVDGDKCSAVDPANGAAILADRPLIVEVDESMIADPFRVDRLERVGVRPGDRPGR